MSDPPSALARLSAALADSYIIERELGAGGMATVYLAEDVRHRRKVALKVLRPDLAASLGHERFLREIETTANLRHPHILPLYDSGEADGLLYYVMPYVEGESLRDRLNREKQIPVAEAVQIAREVADALSYAHSLALIHRDIKPENILLERGHAVVADFGIARAVSTAGGNRLTETGISIGTPQYMSPEQASGDRVVDGRTDVYALGCVLYEMLAGEPPISGPTTQATIARLMMEDPRSLTLIRKTVPPALEAVVFKALAKLPADRFAGVAEFTASLDDPAFDARWPTRREARTTRHAGSWQWRLPVLAALAVALAALAIWGWLRPRAAPPAAVTRFVLSFPPDEEPGLSFYGTSFTLSRDGSRMAYIGTSTTGQHLLVRSRDQLRATLVPGTQNVYAPAFSPDGRSLAFVTGSPGALRAVPLAGGTPVTLVPDGVLVVHVLWGPDGFLYYTDVTGALVRVPETGGAPEVVARPDTARGQRWFTHPDVIEDRKIVVFTIWPSGPTGADTGPDIAAVRLPAGEVRAITRGMNAHTDVPGQLIFADRDYHLLVAPFDARSVRLTGPARSLGVRVAVAPDGSAHFALSPAGTLLYAGEDTTTQRVAWVARDGRVTYVDTTWSARIISLALSPDGKQLAVGQGDRGGTDIWVKTLDRGPLTRLTHWGSQTYRPGWAPDGKSLTFVSNHEGIQKLFTIPADGSGAPKLLFTSANGVDEGGWSPDGRWLIVRSGVGVRRDIVGVRPGLDRAAVPLVATPFEEFSPALSPDGRWIAYVSDESTRPEVYVRPFPETATARWQVSTAGGLEPVWGHGGRELYYRNGAGDLVVATITGTPTFRVVSQKTLFPASRLYAEGFHQTYAVAPDGRFLFVEGKFESSATLVRVDNWLEELTRPTPR